MTKQMKPAKPTETQMSEALMRSGYLLESRIISKLVKDGYIVEPNQCILDLKTGKSREIDLIANFFDFCDMTPIIGYPVFVNTYFVCEVKNNPDPVVLLTKLPYSPNLSTWESMHEGKTGFFANNDLNPSFYDFFIKEHNVYTQFCSFQRKKGNADSQFMACHPDNFYDNLEKITSFCRNEAKSITSIEDNTHRLLLHLPVVILGGDIYVADLTEDAVTLARANAALHMHFDIEEGEQGMSLILFVTEKYFLKLFKKINKFGKDIQLKVREQLSHKS